MNSEPKPPKPFLATRILLVDIHSRSRKSTRLLLDALPGLTVVGETADFVEALDMTQRLTPDVVLISMRVEGASGPETVRQILQVHPLTRVVVLTLFDEPEYVKTAMAAGAHAYVLKHEPAAEILKAIDIVMDGGTYLSAGLSLKK
jgi:DNA-binding NarL/FixJ family response regulator